MNLANAFKTDELHNSNAHAASLLGGKALLLRNTARLLLQRD